MNLTINGSDETRDIQIIEGITNLNRKKGFLHIDNLKNIRGEFVGVIAKGNHVYIFRDRVGGRSIYFGYLDPITICISTDPIHILNLNKKRKLDNEYFQKEYIPFQVPFGMRTPYLDVKRVPPATIIHFQFDNNIGMWTYFNNKYWRIDDYFGNEKFDSQYLLSLIKDSILSRLSYINRSKYTTYLSGGIDSSSIVSLVKPKEVFSGYYEEEYYSERDYIEVLHRHMNSFDYHLIPIKKERFHELLGNLNKIIPDPTGGLGIIAQIIVAQRAKECGYDYAFTGEGGDEIFFGYPWNRVVMRVARTITDLDQDRYMIRWDPMIEIARQRSLPGFVNDLIKRDHSDSSYPDWISSLWMPEEKVENNIMKINIEVGLPAILMVDEYVGRFTGIEPISPFVDHKIIEYVASVNPEERCRIPKNLLRQAMKDILPEKIRTRYDKMGFPVPYEKWDWPMLDLIPGTIKDTSYEYPITMDRRAWGLLNMAMIMNMVKDGKEVS